MKNRFNEKNYNKQNAHCNHTSQGITLVALVITIIVLLILAGVGINIAINTDGLFGKASESVFKTDIGVMQEEYTMYLYQQMMQGRFDKTKLSAGENSVTYEGKQIEGTQNIYDVLPITKKYKESFEIIQGEIYYRGDKQEQIVWAGELGIPYNPFIIVEGELKSANKNLELVGEDGTVTIPPNVTKIAEGAFNNVGLRTLTIPGTVKEIARNAFANNACLEKVIIEEGVEVIGDSAFLSCGNLKEVQMANSISQIGNSAFMYCKSLETINLSTNLTELSAYLFNDCQKLNNIVITERIKTINYATFGNCKNMTKLNLPESLNTIQSGALSGMSNLQEIEIKNNSKFVFEDGILYGNSKSTILFMTSQYNEQKKITIAEGIVELSESVFSNCNNLETLYIPASVSKISGNFSGLTNLKEIEVNENNEKYSSVNGSLYNKEKDTILLYLSEDSNIVLQEGIRVIDEYAFKKCKNLQTIRFSRKLSNN